ncbi:MAG: alanine/glycine:cation symporter family protein [Mangrovibacterium sp.]
MSKLNDVLALIDSYIGGSTWFVFFLLGTGLFFTIYLKFPQFRYLKYSFKILSGKFDDKNDKGDTSHFQALSTALSGTVGTGNIAGVALAIHLGGPAALFWMLVTALVGMTTKFVEVSLSHKYRERTADGTMAGGPMYYMKNRLNMKWLAVIFALATIASAFGTGSLPQINSISNSLFSTFGINKVLTGAVLAILLAFVTMGGIKRIANVTSRLVPFMAIVYFVGAIAVICYNYQNFIPAIESIFTNVFNSTSATGGFLGASFAFAFNRGVNRGLFSNEAGQGSAPIAHASAKGHESVSEGLVALLEPFIDTIVICSLTGLVILSSGVWTEKIDNQFQTADINILGTKLDDHNEADRAELHHFLVDNKPEKEFTGDLHVENGIILNKNITLLHARSVAENVVVYNDDKAFTGDVPVKNGYLNENIKLKFEGKSLIHSAPLTTQAFSRSWFGEYGKYIVSFGLLLFAFSTAIAWSYYGDRAVIFLWGEKALIYFRIIYPVSFFFAAFTDTTIIWTLSGITIALMTIPNLIGILLLRKEVKSDIKSFWVEYGKRFPNEKVPKG